MKKEIFEYINSIINGTKITEFTIQKGNTKIYIVRNPEIVKKEKRPENKEASEIKTETSLQKPKEEKRVPILSPTVGIFYRGKTKLSPPLVKLNSYVKKGDVVGIVDCIGVIEKVISPVSGKVVEILVDNHKPVEYNMPLFIIETE